MLWKPTSAPRIAVQIGLHKPIWKPGIGFRNYAATTGNSGETNGTVDTAKTVRVLRAKEHRLRNSILFGFAAATVVSYYLDGKYNGRAIRRTLRTAWVGALLAADYKWNFTPEKAEQIEDLHKRVAKRVLDLIRSNGGLYIKLGMCWLRGSKLIVRTSVSYASRCITARLWGSLFHIV
jgi:hypothetical protein